MPPNWVNRTLWTGDNLDILRGMNSASVDLIYLDPPFNSNRDYEAPIGSKAAGAVWCRREWHRNACAATLCAPRRCGRPAVAPALHVGSPALRER